MDTFELRIARKIPRWDEGIPLGNGDMGCLLFGQSDKLIFSLDRGDIWDKTCSPEKTTGFNYHNLIKLKKEGNAKDIGTTFDVPYYNPTPTKLPTGKLIANLGVSKTDCFGLDIKKAEATYSNDSHYIQTFTHATEKVGMFVCNNLNATFDIVNPKFGSYKKWDKLFQKFRAKNAVSNKLKNVKYPLASFKNESCAGINLRYFIQLLNDNTCYGVILGTKIINNCVQGAYYAYHGNSAEDVERVLKGKVISAIEKGYDTLIVSHIKWWQDYFDKSKVILPDKYIENRYNLGNYLLGSASRKGCYPMPLQGLWTACDDKMLPPWKGDYHHDLNTQMSYYSYLKSNHIEQGESFIDYLVSLWDRAREFAKNCYNANGICLPSVMDIDGYAMGGWAMYSLSPTNQLWLCQVFERHFNYTYDMEFLQNIAYPYMSQSADFILSLLKEDAEGFWVLEISSSPEIHDNTLKSFLQPNSNYDLAMMTYIFKALGKLAKIQNLDSSKWDNALKKLHPLAVNKQNVLKLSRNEDLLESHRHLAHAMAIHPLRLLDYSCPNDKIIIDATIKNIEKLGYRFFTGYTFAWLSEFYTIAKNGDMALKYLQIFYKYFCSINSFHLNGDYTRQGYSTMHYRPFTLEGNFCAVDTVQEMLLFSENGIMEFFPALPSTWGDVEFYNLRATGGLLVSCKTKNSKIAYVKITATKDYQFTIKNAICEKFVGTITLKENETLEWKND